jgi:hypothetical protein
MHQKRFELGSNALLVASLASFTTDTGCGKDERPDIASDTRRRRGSVTTNGCEKIKVCGLALALCSRCGLKSLKLTGVGIMFIKKHNADLTGKQKPEKEVKNV